MSERSYDVRAAIGVGASAGGVEALIALAGRLPPDLAAPVFVVLHIPASGTSALAQILDRSGPLPAQTAVDGEAIAPGRIYVAPSDRHLLVEDGVTRLSAGPRENGHRPAVDPMLRSVAAYGARALGVVLSGTRDDGTAGLARIKAAGGVAIAQAPGEAAYDGMIRSAIENVDLDAVVPMQELAAMIARFAQGDDDMGESVESPQPPDLERSDTRYTCPECGGHVSREHDGGLLKFSCEVGHAYSPESLDGDQAVAVERALWAAARLLGDRASLLEEMAQRADAKGHDRSARGFRQNAREALDAGGVIRGLLEQGRVPTAGGAGVQAG